MKIPKEITPDIAELFGIITGDGYVRIKHPVWLSIECSANERDYIDRHVKNIVQKIFGIEVKTRFYNRNGIKNTYGFCITKSEIPLFLSNYNLHFKHTVISVPEIILSGNSTLKKRFLRGLIDTDGCMSFIKKKEEYSYPRLNVSSVSVDLMSHVCEMFREFNIKGSFWAMKTPKLPLLRFEIKGKMVEKYMKTIGSKNPNIISKFSIWKALGCCKTNTSYDQRLKILSSIRNPTNIALVAQFG
ncbi:MAG: hypothetical protein HYU56_00840 [Candidatus Aenigmarchaeota archaeon]|nr:hypothetical protein [Candidatus Aenigmarchaeota archaeon]